MACKAEESASWFVPMTFSPEIGRCFRIGGTKGHSMSDFVEPAPARALRPRKFERKELLSFYAIYFHYIFKPAAPPKKTSLSGFFC